MYIIYTYPESRPQSSHSGYGELYMKMSNITEGHFGSVFILHFDKFTGVGKQSIAA